ncbi:uncharacterized protein LOC105794612 [Gossypium raimondii]|uniref:PB1 domain-containing protein n=1 Tax=Gossypium raimondii TaxID=29730 RepID=A0A0D2RH40_GOSRA|nr:uncharacterized protein LOC105794612 [Gossypium raimondii]KJB31128.1 hypothetical protein B456_005G178300 [Gossypium raimondii]KJB31129.1 hypothetical protein B456_005G178300 [Gossypium raimondii]KJB31130.1 hypothetical protein B456_005G178300 [Gossypium raimondii]KJB31131.1 hypothetical protein B456_005G178300 [Gossypium raimondii]KJB31133.1 hypothetical protein B456_005G178300 [Gossypium raimondii]
MVGTKITIKFLCSYGGKIVPRYPDGKLRYYGGETRVLAVDRSIPFSELLVKMGEMYGSAVSLRCQLPTEDLDALVSITSDEDLANLIEEYDRVASPPSSIKIRAFLSPPRSTKKDASPPSSSASSSKSSSTSTPRYSCIRQISRTPVAYPLCSEKSAGKMIPYYGYHGHHGNPSHIYLIHSGNYWQ